MSKSYMSHGGPMQRAGQPARQVTASAKRCLYCGGHELPEGAEFCPNCGQRLKAAIYIDGNGKRRIVPRANGCLYCGALLPESAKVCPGCGRSLARGFLIRLAPEAGDDCPHP